MSFSTPQNNSSQVDNCVWTINVTNCFGQEYFQLIYGVTTYLSLFVFLCSIWLLFWRLYSKPGTNLFKLKGFLTLEGYLFIQIFWGAARVAHSIILIYNLFQGQWIVRQVVLITSWYLGLVSVVTYLAGVLRTIPRMHFYRQNPHYEHSLHLPTLRGIAGVYASYIFVLGIISISCAVLTGYLQQYPKPNSYQLIKIIMAIHYSTCSIGAFLLTVGFLVYGNQLVGIAKEGIHLLERVSGYPSKGSSDRYSRQSSSYIMGAELELKHKKLQRSVRKMRIINIAFILTFLVLSIILGSFAFFNEQIINNIEISQITAGVTNLLPMVLNVAVMAGIAYGELKVPDKSEPRLDNIVIPTNSNKIHMERVYLDTETLNHSRNNSTDSDAPLLRWPAPVHTTSARRGSSQLDSPTSVTSSTSGTSPLATSSTLLPSASTSNQEYYTSMSV